MKKILVLFNRPIPPITMGTERCIMDCCRLLIKMGHEVFFLCGIDKNKSLEALNYWGDHIIFYKLNIIDNIYTLFKIVADKLNKYNNIDRYYKPSITRWIKKYNNIYKFDTIIVNYISNSRYLKEVNISQKVINTIDVFSYRKKRFELKNFWYNINPNLETKALNRADIILAIQNDEALIFKYLCPKKEIYTVYTPFEIRPGKIGSSKNILFLAGNNEINQNGIDYFLNEIFPTILKKDPEVKLIIGGTICEYLNGLSNCNVELCGRVEKIDDFYNKGDVLINPIYQGTGMKMKVFEALSYGKTVVADSHSIEGVYLPEKFPVLIGETPQEFSNHLINVLYNREMRLRYYNQAINYMEALNSYIEGEYKKIFQ